eukprot:SAG31_NODE_2070_length_6517_cov_7.896385_5_plen_219_part_00
MLVASVHAELQTGPSPARGGALSCRRRRRGAGVTMHAALCMAVALVACCHNHCAVAFSSSQRWLLENGTDGGHVDRNADAGVQHGVQLLDSSDFLTLRNERVSIVFGKNGGRARARIDGLYSSAFPALSALNLLRNGGGCYWNTVPDRTQTNGTKEDCMISDSFTGHEVVRQIKSPGTDEVSLVEIKLLLRHPQPAASNSTFTTSCALVSKGSTSSSR